MADDQGMLGRDTSKKSVIAKRGRLGFRIWFLILTLPVLEFFVAGSLLSFRNEIANWTAPQSEARIEFERYRQKFDTNDFLVVSWPGFSQNNLFNEKIIADLNACPMVDVATSGWDVYRLLRDDLDLSHKTAMLRLKRSLITRDGQSAGIFITLNEEAIRQRVAAIGCVKQILNKYGVTPSTAKFAGPAYDIYTIDQEGFWSPVRPIALIALFAFLLTWWFVGELKMAVFINGLGLYTGQFALALVNLSGHHLNALIWTLPTLILLLTASATLHFRAYYRKALVTGGEDDVVDRAFAAAWRPIVYCATTTAVGLFSLMLSETRPVAEFGMFGGIAVLVSATLVLWCMPEWLRAFPHFRILNSTNKVATDWIWNALASGTCRFRWAIIATSLLLLVFGAVLIPNIKTSVNIRNFFPNEHKVVQDQIWIERELLPLSAIEVLLHFQDTAPENDVNRLRWVEAVSKRIKKLEGVEATISAGTFAPKWPKLSKTKSVSQSMQRHELETRVAELRERLPESRLVRISKTGDNELWRISAHVEFDDNKALKQSALQVEATVNDFFEQTSERLLPGEKLVVSTTGLSLLFNHVEDQFLSDLMITYSTAFLLISILIFMIMRSFTGFLICSMPNLFPALVVLGGAVAFQIDMDVATLMVTSVALGIAVDDTLHFVLWWREKVQEGWDSRNAVVDALKHCGMAMIQTSAICGLSVLFYALANFLPTVRFGLMLSAMLFAALIGDLILLPALLSTKFAARIVTAKT